MEKKKESDTAQESMVGRGAQVPLTQGAGEGGDGTRPKSWKPGYLDWRLGHMVQGGRS